MLKTLLNPGIPAGYKPPTAHFGALEQTTTESSIPAKDTMSTVMYAASTAGMIAGAYHGYKRNDSIGWAIGWGILGSLFWPIAIPVAIGQGFGKPAK